MPENKLSTTILNYFAAFTETKFNFRTLINYRWTNNELTLDLAIFQDFQDSLLQKIKTGDNTPLTVRNNEHILSLSGDEVLLEINEAISDRFSLDYLKTCVNQEFTKRAERITTLVATEKGVQPAKDADLSKEELKKHNEQAFLDGCRKYNLAFRKQIELILIELQEKKIDRLKDELGIEHVSASTFNSANYLKKHFDGLQAIARDSRTEDEYFGSVKKYFKEAIEDIGLYDLFTSIQQYARYNTVGTEERDLVYYSLVEDSKYGNAELRNIYPVIDRTADNIRSLKMQRLNVGFSRAKDTMIFAHSMPVNKYGKTRLGDAVRHYDKLLNQGKKNDFFVEDPSIFESPAEKGLYNILVSTNFVKTHREHVKIIPQFKIGEYIRAEYARQIPKYRVDFLLTYSKGGKERTLILEYDGVEYHTKNPDIVTKHNFTQEYLDYDISRQIELESYGYRFLRLNKFNLRPEQKDETKMDVLDRLLKKAFDADE